jgi:hypothetical protein
MSMKLSALLLVFGICMCFGFTGQVAYANEYNSTSNFMLLSGSGYDSPKFDCKSDSECVMLVYNDVLDRIELSLTFDKFRTINTTMVLAGWTPVPGHSIRDNYPFVYDVQFINDSFYNLEHRRTLYSFNSSTQTLATVCTISDDDYFILGFYNSTYMVVGQTFFGNGNFNINLVKNDCNLATKISIGTWLGLSGYGVSDTNIDDITGFIAWKSGFTSTTEIIGTLDITIRYSTHFSAQTDLNGFPSTYDGLWDYANNKIYFRNVTYVATASTTDMSTWGTAQIYYTFGNTIQREDRKSFTGHDVVMFENSSGIFVGDTWEAPAYSPAVEYTSGTRIYATSSWLAFLGYRSYSPKVDCQGDMQHCLMLVYDTGAYWSVFPAIIGLYSVDGFQTITSTFIIPNSGVLGTEITDSNFAYQALPYDVKYNSVDDKYYIVANDNTANPKVYNWSSSGGLGVRATLSFDCEQYGNQRSIFGIAGKETSNPEILVMCAGWGGVSPGLYGYDINLERYWLYNGSYITTSGLQINLGCSSPINFCTSLDLASGGFVDGLNEYKIVGRVYSTGSAGSPNTYANTYTSSNINTYFPTDSTGLQYWREGIDLVYTRAEAGSVHAGQYKTLTDNFISYTTPVLYYSWDLTNAETIPRTDRVVTSNYRVYAYERNHATNAGIFVYRETIMPIYVFARYVNPVTQQPDNPVSVNAQLTCPSGYTTTGIGSDVTLHTTCESAMNLQLLATGFLPTLGNITFDKISGCNSMFVRANYLPSSYSVNVTVRDQQTGSVISGATVTMSGVGTFTTDSQGHASVTVQPVMSPYFVHSSDIGACTETMQVSGTARSYWLQVSATGFRTSNYYNFKFVDETVLNSIIYFTYKNLDALTLYLTKGADVEVRVYTFDGVPVENNLVSIKASGATVYVMSDGVPVAIDTATQFPATFRLINSSESFIATFNLTQGTYYEMKTLTIVNTTNYYSLSFTLPEASSYACVSSADCTSSYCQGTFFYELNDCVGGQCVYDVSSCTLCDAEAGCYEQTSSTECFFDTDCIDTCANPGFLSEGLCGSSNLCIFHMKECSNGCVSVVEGEDYCGEAPPIVSCDQSTVVGMLSCMQSGLMSFIGSAYSPMFMIGLALFIMIIVITILGLAFKGAQNVIR